MHHKFRIHAISIISLCTVLAIFVSGCFISGCRRSNNDAKFTSATSPTTLSWYAPTTYTDGSALLDLKEYRVYFSTSPDPYSTGSYFSVPASTTSVKVRDIIPVGTGTYYFVITAVDSTDTESDPSNVAIKSLY
jgi:hypothetical protein